jgi:hypothetical protein
LCRLKKVYGFERGYILYKLSCLEGWAWYAWSIENNGVAAMELAELGYVGQEVEDRRRMKPSEVAPRNKAAIPRAKDFTGQGRKKVKKAKK